MAGREVVGGFRQRVLMESVDLQGRSRPLGAVFGYRTADPYAVTITFGDGSGAVRWVVGRDLLARGVTRPCGEGDVRIWPAIDDRGHALTVVELLSPDGHLVTQAPTRVILRFLARTVGLVPSGDESAYVDVDALVGEVLGDLADGSAAD